MTPWLLIGAGVLLTLGTAVFVAAEFSLVALDPSHVDGKRSGRVKRALATLSTQLSAAQVGITLTTILLGYTAQPAITELLRIPLDDSSLSRAAVGAIAGTVSLIVVNAFSMIIGELVPKNLALAEPMRTARVAAPLIMAFTTALGPLIRGLNSAANAILRAMGIEPKEELSGGRSPQELATLVRRSAEAGTLDADTARLLTNTIDLDSLSAVDVMTDRTRVVMLPASAKASDVLAAARASGHSRFPVTGDGPDDVLGIVTLAGAIGVPVAGRDEAPVTEIMAATPRVPETIGLRPLLVELRGLALQCAIVVDEYGGTAGLVTLEDLVEELVGDVSDEHDRRRPPMHKAPGGAWIAQGDLRPDEVVEYSGIEIPESPAYETIGGFVMARLGRVAAVGDVVEADGVRVTVERMEGRRIDRVRLVRAEGGES
ncbi:hemolysin family protein [Demequina sp.]|uniref:hemolysin family protein n=1 Tax=Demequina sp. TaxID=2050685 RepID=UPI003D0BDC65